MSKDEPNQWFCVDLRNERASSLLPGREGEPIRQRSVRPTAYTLRHYSSLDKECLRSVSQCVLRSRANCC